MELSGWGRFPVVSAEFVEPLDFSSLQMLLASSDPSAKLVPRGAGLSYGDSALAARVIGSRFMDNFSAIDETARTIRCGSGVSLRQLLRLCMPRGWFLPVVPGTANVSVGGAIAADVHGKNHHLDGSFCDHVLDLTLLLANGELIRCSKTSNPELFQATCGGMGLTGIIIEATLQLREVPGVFIQRRSLLAHSLRECFELFEVNSASSYSVAWLDCLARGKQQGRSVLYLGEHVDVSNKRPSQHPTRGWLTVPFDLPASLLNSYSLNLFNSAYFQAKRYAPKSDTVNSTSYFFPLDGIAHWNRLYGQRGFLQYQCLIPDDGAFEAISAILHKVSRAGKGSFLSVLKKMGAANSNLLSFPGPGYTLALDFKFEPGLFALLEELDAVVLAYGGRLYLAKDARMSEAVFKAGYPQWEKFVTLKQKIDPHGLFASQQSDRVGLTQAVR
jgi:decaprenylphospho-beta-D-ribofuranose 2-oxidase